MADRVVATLQRMNAEIEKLNKFYDMRKKVHQALEDAEGRRLKNNAARVWIEKFEDIAYEMEDLLDEFWKLKILNGGKSTLEGKVSLFNSCISCVCFNQVPDVSLRFKELDRRLDLLLNQANDQFISSFGSGTEPDREFYRHPPTTSSIDESRVHGRESDKECLIPVLLQAAHNGVKVISILGAGGSGKTTLAQCLYNDYRVKEYFDVRKWLCVSDSFDSEMILRTLLEDPNGLTGFDSLLELVRKQLSGKKFLLVLDDVLDDVWNGSTAMRESFWNSIQHVAPGSIILVTTVSKNVAKEVGSNHEHFLRPLLTLDCWVIMKRIALSEKPQFSKGKTAIGLKFAKKCNGSPLVAGIIGSLLQFKHTAQEWQEALDMEIWKNEEIAMHLYHHLYVSYQNLSAQLKTCFSYCAVFPKDTCIDVERLLRLLIALGYVSDPCRNTKTVKLGVGGYAALAMLETMSFLSNAKRSIHKNKMTSYKIPELCHSFAEYVRPDFTMLGQLEKLGRDSRSMRSFVILSPCKLPQGLFKKMKYVRALVLSCCELEEVSSDVANLTYLRFLDLSGNPLKELPETICMLLCLQSLYLHSCYQLMSLPQKIGHLGLRHLRINYTTDELHDVPLEFEKLTSIQTLDMFRIGGRYNNVQRLRNLNDLEDIRIAVHGDVHFPDADLESKSKLGNLELCFIGEGRDQEKAACIENLVPPPNLEMLKLEDYPRVKLPRWILSESLINKLKRLSLRSAANISSFPALWKLSSLEFLWLYDIPNVTRLGREFFGLPRSTLQQHYSEKENQKTWSYLQISRESDDEDMISDYDEEDGEDDHNATVGEVTTEGDGERAEKLTAFRSLKTLRIEYLENLKIWEDVDEAGERKMKPRFVMPSLEEIIIADCPILKQEALPHRILGKISSLKITIDGKPVDIKSDSTGEKPSSSKGKAIMVEPKD